MSHNRDHKHTPEHVDMPSFLWIIWMVRCCVRAAVALRRPIPRLTVGLDDMKAAYRMIAQLLPLTMYVIYFCFRLQCSVIQRTFGHYFGLKAANNNYSRLPRFGCMVCGG